MTELCGGHQGGSLEGGIVNPIHIMNHRPFLSLTWFSIVKILLHFLPLRSMLDVVKDLVKYPDHGLI